MLRSAASPPRRRLPLRPPPPQSPQPPLLSLPGSACCRRNPHSQSATLARSAGETRQTRPGVSEDTDLRALYLTFSSRECCLYPEKSMPIPPLGSIPVSHPPPLKVRRLASFALSPRDN
ncbi:ESX-1 secretion-associated protein EspI-like [Phyllostomus hastatus]|uniref:ESX-1 secretion-associated protein EspI-like n=1 Tax=Phyllostomus hastatus TaxID=9423 RepID=UPI001E6812A2|nr:ESX-1 secretion-associated protein EspI-like [Phyllostomus hastatus]